MAFGHALRSLAIYDILTNLIPGGVLLTSISLALIPLFAIPNLPASVMLAVFLVLSYVLGHFVQAYSSYREGTLTTFGDTVTAIREGNPSEAPISTTYIDESFWKYCVRVFNLPNDFENHRRLLQLILSHLETTSHTRALRFQTLHAFHRSMWGVSEIAIIISLLIAVLTGFMTKELHSIVAPLVVLGFAIAGRMVFNSRREKFNERFVEYVFVDFYEDSVSRSPWT